MRIWIVPTSGTRHIWLMEASNSTFVAQSYISYRSWKEAYNAARNVWDMFKNRKWYRSEEEINGNWYWFVQANNGTKVVRSYKAFKTRKRATESCNRCFKIFKAPTILIEADQHTTGLYEI